MLHSKIMSQFTESLAQAEDRKIMPLTPNPFLSPNMMRHLHNKKYGTNYKPIESVDMKSLQQYKRNAEDDYPATPISVLRYITKLEKKLDDSKVIRIEPEMINEAGNENIPLLMSIMLIAIVIACIAVVGLAFSV